ncbi:NAD(P)/FAD-dependent oxidoreductase [Microvirga solisilvae]|uniref:NAD(P)/FAD-dependent oxidoreductase n=1 Tax=Microvirga solisilvae TaxID=2919498 RepID=UPI001FAEE8E1
MNAPFHASSPRYGVKRLKIAVIGSGISGLSAAWLLGKSHDVTLIEADERFGGHSHTVDAASKAGGIPVDTGFIVYNEPAYPNLTALFCHLSVPTRATDMSFAVSRDDGTLEYAGTDLAGIFAQKRNAFRPRFWSMLSDLVRFYRNAPADLAEAGLMSLGDYLDAKGYGTAFREDHLYPMAAAIWSTPRHEIQNYPAAAFIRFCENHGLLKFADRPIWRTVDGGSRVYVEKLLSDFSGQCIAGDAATRITRKDSSVTVETRQGTVQTYDHVVMATHADQALRLLADPTAQEMDLLGAFRYSRNRTMLHCDERLMPRRRSVWASWNYLSRRDMDATRLSVTYWMNRLQNLPEDRQLFVTLNPAVEPRPETVLWEGLYEHPLFDREAILAQEKLWSLQGGRNTWFCGAYFGSGFHEDGLQAGLAVAEELGGLRRPWQVSNESGRICLPARVPADPLAEAA